MNLVTLWRRGLTGLKSASASRIALIAGSVGIVALFTASPVSAQSDDEWRDRGDVRRDTREMRVDRAQWMADRRDVRRLRFLVLMLDRAQVSGDKHEEQRMRERIHGLLRRELFEAGRDLNQDRREEGQSRDELYRDYMERRGGDEIRDDRRDFRDDRRDTEESRRRLMRQVEMLRRLREIQPAVERRNRGAMNEEDRLLHSFLRLAREDMRADRREWNEDRRERREDVRDKQEMQDRENARERDEPRDKDENRDDKDDQRDRDKDDAPDSGDWY
jgi:hypothetical protein